MMELDGRIDQPWVSLDQEIGVPDVYITDQVVIRC